MTTPLEQVVNGVEGMTYITVLEHQQRLRDDHRLLRHRPRPRPGRGRRAEPRQPGARAACRPTCAPTASPSPRTPPASWAASASSRRTTATARSSSATTWTSTCATRIKRVPGVGNVIIFGERKYAMRAVARPRAARRPRHHRRRRGERAARAEPAGRRPARSATPRPTPNQTYNLSVRAMGRLTEVGAVRERRREGGHGRRPGARPRRRPRRARRRDLLVQPALRRPRGLRHGHPAAAVGQRARRLRRRDGGDGAAREELPARARVAARLRQRRRRPRVDQRGARSRSPRRSSSSCS